MDTHNFSRWSKLTKTGHISGQQSDTPKQGVWIQSERIEGDFQHTVEHVALNGLTVKSMHCYHGHGRSMALQYAVKLATNNL